ncbi:MAG: hypothetical protein ACI97N_001028, partial [Cognaticolwellia sp.]
KPIKTKYLKKAYEKNTYTSICIIDNDNHICTDSLFG